MITDKFGNIEFIMDIKKIYDQYKDTVPYLIFGFLTTAVNVAAYWLFARIFKLGVMPATITAWVLAVFFAYVTNRKYVFHSRENSKFGILKEMVSFFACRLTTGFIDWSCMYIFVDIFHLNDIFIKIISNIIVVVLNYIASKMVIFRNKKQ